MLKAKTAPHPLVIHLWTLPRWFAAPFTGTAAITGALLAGGLTFNSWLGVIAVLLIMAGGHSFNSFLDYAWTGLDKGKKEDRSAEKDYTAGQSLLAEGFVTLRQVLINALSWYALALIPLIYLALQIGWPILIVGLAGMLVTFWYSKAKFNWTHELALSMGMGILPALAGMFATVPDPPWVQGLLAGVPFGFLIGYAGLALDEYPDAEANLKKGVKSLAYKVWEYGISLEWYTFSWISFLYIYQILLINLDIYKPLTGLSFLTFPLFLASVVFLRRHFNRAMNFIILTAWIYFILLTLARPSAKNHPPHFCRYFPRPFLISM